MTYQEVYSKNFSRQIFLSTFLIYVLILGILALFYKKNAKICDEYIYMLD